MADKVIRELEEYICYKQDICSDGFCKEDKCPVNNAIQTIRELQSKADEVCEWEYLTSTSYQARIHCNGFIRNIKSMKNYKFCPYCGRKIKVIE